MKEGYVPHAREYAVWKPRVRPEDLEKIKDALNNRMDANQIHVSSWIPGADWMGTVYQPLYEATMMDETMAAMFFGLVLWETLMERDDVWGFVKWEQSCSLDEYRSDPKNKPRGMVYWRLIPAPKEGM